MLSCLAVSLALWCGHPNSTRRLLPIPWRLTPTTILGGISGVSMAYHLKTKCPDKTFAVLEGRGEIGGTWSLLR